MKKILLTVLIALCGMNVFAQETIQDGTSCETAFVIDTAYHAALTEGNYWYTAQTTALPLILYIYPEDTTAQIPDVFIDLTCTPEHYDDPNVARMLDKAGDYGLSFPMKENPEKHYDANGDLYYQIMYDVNYRNMLYEQGVTYAIPAYINLFLYCPAEVSVASRSINTQCRDFVNAWTMNTSLRLAPADSANVYVWPIGEWIDKKYQITWEGEGDLLMFDGKSCLVDRGSYVRQSYTMPKDKIIMTTTRTSEWINDPEVHQTELYARLYPQTEGLLKILEIVEQEGIATFIISGISAMIDNDGLTISATLPSGMSKTDVENAIKSAVVTNFAGDTLAWGNELTYAGGRNPKMTYKSKTYSLAGIVSAATPGNTDATLAEVFVDGVKFDDFSPSIALYYDVETTTEKPIFTATATSDKATITYIQPTAVPGICMIEVKAEAGNTQLYTFNVIKGRSRNTNLSSITVNGKPLAGFTPSELYYRMEVTSLPVVEAVAEDPLSKVTVSQAKQVPGYAQIYVEAEAGNINTYSINFSEDPALAYCRGSVDTVAIDEVFELEANSDLVLRFPAKTWKNDYVRLNWTNASAPLTVFISTVCQYEPSATDENVLEVFELEVPKGKANYEFNLRPADIQRLAKRSVDGNLYIRFSNASAGNFTVTNWVENCVTRGNLIEPGDELEIQGQSHSVIRKFYAPDYKNKDIRFIWEGGGKLEMYFSAICDFRLSGSSGDVLNRPPFYLTSNDSVDVTTETWTKWAHTEQGKADEDEVDGFIYARFDNHQSGKLTVKVLKTYTTDLGQWSEMTSNLRVMGGEQELTIRSFAKQTVSVFSIDGTLVATLTLNHDEETTLNLSAGLYIVRGTQSAIKAIVK